MREGGLFQHLPLQGCGGYRDSRLQGDYPTDGFDDKGCDRAGEVFL